MDPIFVEGTDPKEVHPLMAAKLDEAIEKIQAIQKKKLVLRAPKKLQCHIGQY